MIPLGLDSETELICAGKMAPDLVCATTFERGLGANLVAVADGTMGDLLHLLFEPAPNGLESHVVGHNIAYDLGVFVTYDPSLFPFIFEALAQGRVHDTMIREKLLVLAETGDLEYAVGPHGKKKLDYKLASILLKCNGKDISALKDENDAWRLNYGALKAVPSAQWPADAIGYAKDDAEHVVDIWEWQEERGKRLSEMVGVDVLQTATFRTAISFCLRLMTIRGGVTDHAAIAQVEAMVAEELKPANLKLLLGSGILRPGSDPHPAKNNSKSHTISCVNPRTCDCPPKMVQGANESINKKALTRYVLDLAAASPDKYELRYTEITDAGGGGNLQVDAAWLDEFAAFDPLLLEYQKRSKLQKIVTTELPRMRGKDGMPAAVVHPLYDVLKETGRTSSYGSKDYPSFNCQNVDPRVRQCYIPRPGFVFCSTDFGAMELVTDAQVSLDLFGESVLADKLKAGIDPHAYLGSQLAFTLSPEFQETCTEGGVTDADAIYDVFISCKDSEDKGVRDFFKQYRKFAKPTGLGYPGGLGPKTFIAYAKATFDVDVDFETATQLREVWRSTYPEKSRFFKWLNTEGVDPHNGPVRRVIKGRDGEPDTERLQDLYRYVTPLGMYRAACDYCAAANGMCLQSPSAEGALLALFNVCRACYDYTQNSPLYGNCFPLYFIHDEIISEVREMSEDPQKRHEICYEKARIMADSFGMVCKDVPIKAAPVLMRRWDKGAEAVFKTNEVGLPCIPYLIPWDDRPREKAITVEEMEDAI